MRERNINVWLPLTWPPLGTWPATQAYAWEFNHQPFGSKPVLNPLSYTSQGLITFLAWLTELRETRFPAY